MTSDSNICILQLTRIMSPSSNDVLCGRGGGSFGARRGSAQGGNLKFYSLIEENWNKYVTLVRTDKLLLAEDIVSHIRDALGGRFLEKDPHTGLWHDIGNSKAITKTMRAFQRFGLKQADQQKNLLEDTRKLLAVASGWEQQSCKMRQMEHILLQSKMSQNEHVIQKHHSNDHVIGNTSSRTINSNNKMVVYEERLVFENDGTISSHWGSVDQNGRKQVTIVRLHSDD